MGSKKVGLSLPEDTITLLATYNKKSNIDKSKIVKLALNSYIEPNLEGITIEKAKEILFRVYDDIARLTKLRDDLYAKLQEE